MYILIYYGFQASPEFGFLQNNLIFSGTCKSYEAILSIRWSPSPRCKGLFVRDFGCPALLHGRILHVFFGWERSQENQNSFCLFVFCNPLAVVATSFSEVYCRRLEGSNVCWNVF